MSDLVVKKCPNCHGALNIDNPGQRQVSCLYCGVTVDLFPAAQTPPSQPFAQPPPPQPFVQPSSFGQQQGFTPWPMPDPTEQLQRSVKVGSLISVAVTVVVLIGGLTAFLPLLFMGGDDDHGAVMTSAPSSSASPLGTLVAPAQPTLPASCGLNDSLTIDGAVGRYQQTVIQVGQNCTLTIRNSNLQGPMVIQGGLNARIRIENSTIQGDTVGIAPGMNGHVVLVGNSVVTGNTAAVRLGVNGQLQMTGGRIYSPNTAVEGATNAEVTATDARIESDRTALLGHQNFEARLMRTTVVGSVEPGPNGDVQQM